MLTQERLREVISYDPETGVFVRISDTPGARMGVAGGVDQRGYLAIRVDGKRYFAHRLAWLFVHGEWPSLDLDHANGDRKDNRISNLRLASKSQNKANSQKYSNNTSGFKGVSFRPDSGRWRARIGVDGTIQSLGLFDTAAEAHRAYTEAADSFFGEFART